MENTRKKKLKIIKVLLIVIAIIVFVLLSLLFIYKKTISISELHNEQFDYSLNDINETSNYTYKDFIRYNSKEDPYTLFISISNKYLYKNIIKIDNVANDLFKNYNSKLNRIGLLSNQLQHNLIDFYADVTYGNTFDLYLNGNLRYEVSNNNGLNVYINSITIGDGIPKFISDKILPFHDGELIFSLESNDYEFLKNNTLILNSIEQTVKDKKGLTFKYDYSKNIENVIKYVFKDESNSVYNVVEPLMPMILEILIGENSNENIEYFKEFLPGILKYLN